MGRKENGKRRCALQCGLEQGIVDGIWRPGTEIDIQKYTGWLGTREMLQQACVVTSRPWPFTEFGQTVRIDANDDDIRLDFMRKQCCPDVSERVIEPGKTA
jgi:hypothetical protein